MKIIICYPWPSSFKRGWFLLMLMLGISMSQATAARRAPDQADRLIGGLGAAVAATKLALIGYIERTDFGDDLESKATLLKLVRMRDGFALFGDALTSMQASFAPYYSWTAAIANLGWGVHDLQVVARNNIKTVHSIEKPTVRLFGILQVVEAGSMIYASLAAQNNAQDACAVNCLRMLASQARLFDKLLTSQEPGVSYSLVIATGLNLLALYHLASLWYQGPLAQDQNAVQDQTAQNQTPVVVQMDEPTWQNQRRNAQAVFMQRLRSWRSEDHTLLVRNQVTADVNSVNAPIITIDRANPAKVIVRRLCPDGAIAKIERERSSITLDTVSDMIAGTLNAQDLELARNIVVLPCNHIVDEHYWAEPHPFTDQYGIQWPYGYTCPDCRCPSIPEREYFVRLDVNADQQQAVPYTHAISVECAQRRAAVQLPV